MSNTETHTAKRSWVQTVPLSEPTFYRTADNQSEIESFTRRQGMRISVMCDGTALSRKTVWQRSHLNFPLALYTKRLERQVHKARAMSDTIEAAYQSVDAINDGLPTSVPSDGKPVTSIETDAKGQKITTVSYPTICYTKPAEVVRLTASAPAFSAQARIEVTAQKGENIQWQKSVNPGPMFSHRLSHAIGQARRVTSLLGE